ncbi:hypothetical protein M1145_00015 [Patescibacteria group bacterium]|nr:hypothetical protein [Patescibacteria group bacterium]
MENQAKYIKFLERLNTNWKDFKIKRKDFLVQNERFGKTPEKVTENILSYLFTEVLDWDLRDINYQVDYADIEITKLGIKRIVIEAKRPGGITWNILQLEKHINQALRYAYKQKISTIGVCDGNKLYILNVEGGSTTPRIFIPLDAEEPHEDLYYISKNGIDKKKTISVNFNKDKEEKTVHNQNSETNDELLNKQYKLPARCFAYIGDPNNPYTWKLPYLENNGTIRIKRLQSAIQSIVTNFRGGQVKDIPEKYIPGVLIKLAKAAKDVGKLDPDNPKMANCYRQLYNAIKQMDALDKI